MLLTISSRSWHLRLVRWALDWEDFTPKSLCGYFWLIFIAALWVPLYWIHRVISWPYRKIGFLIAKGQVWDFNANRYEKIADLERNAPPLMVIRFFTFVCTLWICFTIGMTYWTIIAFKENYPLIGAILSFAAVFFYILGRGIMAGRIKSSRKKLKGPNVTPFFKLVWAAIKTVKTKTCPLVQIVDEKND
tara:strand:+ start:418 stop:987 length:570 start_codon:yes stop_codon:yes gene_type:complete